MALNTDFTGEVILPDCDEKDIASVRIQAEWEYVAALFHSVLNGTAEADDGLAICPPAMLTPNGKPRTFLTAFEALYRDGVKVTLPAIHEWILAHLDERRLGLEKISMPEFARLQTLCIVRYPDNIQRLAASCYREGAKRYAESALAGMLASTRKLGTTLPELSNGLASLAQKLEGGTVMEANFDNVLDRLMYKLETGEAAAPLATPWPELNRVLRGGLVPGELCVLAARPGMGKTAFAGNLAFDTALYGKSVLFISLEVKDETVAARMLAREAKIDSRVFREGLASAPHLLQKLAQAREQMRGLPLRIVERSTVKLTPREVRRLAKTTSDLALIVVDYLQLMEPDTRNLNSREREIAEMSRTMKQLALDCDVPVLLLSQLNRRVEEGNREPQLSDLRESGAIEQDADIVMFLHAQKEAQLKHQMPVKAVVAKGRSSGTGAAYLLFDKPFANFEPDTGGTLWKAQENAKKQKYEPDL